MKVYNTLTKKKEEFKELSRGIIKFYCCGPTVYNFIHIGNARPICICDVIRRFLEYKKFNVIYAQNFTDIDDKIIRKANEERVSFSEISKKYIGEYIRDAKGLNIKKATYHPLATENIDGIISIISKLLEKGYAYKSTNGDVYFDVLKFRNYGKLSRQSIEDLEFGARIDINEKKQNPLDFALWKNSKENEPYWESPFGRGRPGWHIECSAMVYRYLGETIDIHFGGQDLIFPHHENEIAQSESFTGKPLSNYWMHNGYINVNNQKMSKSLNNFFTVRDVANKFGYEVIRYFMLSSHYRSPLNYSEEILLQCKNSLERLYSCRNNLDFVYKNLDLENFKEDSVLEKKLLKYKEDFIYSMEDDFNTADALSSLFNLTKEINTLVYSKNISKKLIIFAKSIFDELCEILGILYNRKEVTLEEKVKELIEERDLARKNKKFKEADAIRDELNALGIKLEDTKDGVRWSKVNR